MLYAVETVAILPQGSKGFVHQFLACATEGAAHWHVEKQEKARGFDARVIEVNEIEYAAILAGEWNGFLPSSTLPR